MPITAAGVSAAGNLLAGAGALGGLFGGGGDGIDVSENYRLSQALFDSKMESAKKWGLHPLFALGGTTGYSPVASIPGQSPTGSHKAKAVERLGQVMGNYELSQAQVRATNASASRDEALAAETNARTKNLEQKLQTPEVNAEVTPGMIKPMPSEVVSSAPGEPSTQAGQKPFFAKYVVRKGKDGTPYYWYGPASDEPAEALENVAGLGMAIIKNTGAGVDQWIKWAKQAYNLTDQKVKQLRALMTGAGKRKRKLRSRYNRRRSR